MEVPFRRNVLRRVGTDRQDLHTAPVKLCAKFFESTQLADAVRSPMGPEEFDENKMTVQCIGVEDFTGGITC